MDNKEELKLNDFEDKYGKIHFDEVLSESDLKDTSSDEESEEEEDGDQSSKFP